METDNTPQVDGQQGEPVATVQMIIGRVEAHSPDGTIRILHVNGPVFLNDRIITGNEGSISIVFTDGADTQMVLGRMSDVLIDSDIFEGGAQGDDEDVVASVDEIQAALLEGEFDPTTQLEATASGPTGPDNAGGGHAPFIEQLTGEETTPENPGAETDGVGFSFGTPRVGPNNQQEEEPVIFSTEPAAERSSSKKLESIELEGEVFGYSSFVSNFPIADFFIQNMGVITNAASVRLAESGEEDVPSAAELLEQLLSYIGVESEGLGVGEPDFQLVADGIPGGSSVSRVESYGNEGVFEVRGGQLYFKPSESFEGEAQLSFTLYYDNGDTQAGSVTITERYLKVGSLMNDSDGGEGELGMSTVPYSSMLPSLNYVVGDGQGAIQGGEAGDILIGDSFNIGPILEMMGPEGEWAIVDVLDLMADGYSFSSSEIEYLLQNDEIYGGGGDDLIFGDSLNTTMLNASVFQSIFSFAVEGETEFRGELPEDLAELNLGWYAFTVLEIFNEEWDRNDTIEFILNPDNREGLTEEAEVPEDSNEYFQGYGGNDFLIGDIGDDAIYGQGGHDFIDGWEGNDTLDGGRGNDEILGWTGDDVLLGGPGYDWLHGEQGHDISLGGEGDDHIIDLYDTESGNDILIGGNGADFLDGGSGDDILVGDNAVIHNGSIVLVEDHIEGVPGSGDDLVVGGAGVDTPGEAGGTVENYVDAFENPETGDINTIDGVEDLIPVLQEV